MKRPDAGLVVPAAIGGIVFVAMGSTAWWSVAHAIGLALFCAFVVRHLRSPRRTPLLFFARPARATWLTLWLVMAVELALRVGGYHRTVMYERQGDLLFTPRPNQLCLEKISLTPSRINNIGLRGADVRLPVADRDIVVCLGDSVTYGYGVADAESYPACLQAALDRVSPGRFLVLNAGVNAYPTHLMREKLRHLARIGVRPAVVTAAYTMNEPMMSSLAVADEARKAAFERRIRLKNLCRSIGLYNLIVENYARSFYNRMKRSLLPGTNLPGNIQSYPGEAYGLALTNLVNEIRAQGAAPVMIRLCTFQGAGNRFAATSPHQMAFAQNGQSLGVPVLCACDTMPADQLAGPQSPLFIDHCHMTAAGNRLLAEGLAPAVVAAAQQRPRPQP